MSLVNKYSFVPCVDVLAPPAKIAFLKQSSDGSSSVVFVDDDSSQIQLGFGRDYGLDVLFSNGINPQHVSFSSSSTRMDRFDSFDSQISSVLDNSDLVPPASSSSSDI